MRAHGDKQSRAFIRGLLALTLAKVQQMSHAEPHRMFYILGVACPTCKRHILHFDVGCSTDMNEKTRHLVAKVWCGHIIPMSKQ